MKKFFIIQIIILSTTLSFAQRGEIGVWLGGSYYAGDLNPNKPLLMTRPSFGVVYRHNFTTRIAIRAGGYYGTLIGDDSKAQFITERGLYFKSTIIDGSLLIEFNFLDYFIGSKRNYYSTYIFSGISGFYFNPKAEDGTVLRNIGTEGQNKPEISERTPYGMFSAALPFGVGFKYSMNDKLGLSLEWGMRKTITDYLDDVSTTYFFEGDNTTQNYYADPTGRVSFPEREDVETYVQRGDSQSNDWYAFVGVIVTYKISFYDQKKCRDQDFKPRYYNAID